jgi:hypothetical protein
MKSVIFFSSKLSFPLNIWIVYLNIQSFFLRRRFRIDCCHYFGSIPCCINCNSSEDFHRHRLFLNQTASVGMNIWNWRSFLLPIFKDYICRMMKNTWKSLTCNNSRKMLVSREERFHFLQLILTEFDDVILNDWKPQSTCYIYYFIAFDIIDGPIKMSLKAIALAQIFRVDSILFQERARSNYGGIQWKFICHDIGLSISKPRLLMKSGGIWVKWTKLKKESSVMRMPRPSNIGSDPHLGSRIAKSVSRVCLITWMYGEFGHSETRNTLVIKGEIMSGAISAPR